LVQNAGISFAEKMSISRSVLKLTTTILFEVVNQVSSLLAFSSRKLCGATWSYGTTVPATWRGHTVQQWRTDYGYEAQMTAAHVEHHSS
jgi:hypothetical protein